MRKIKKSSGSTGNFTAKQIQANALSRFEKACDLMIGPGHFHKFSKLCQSRLIAHRFNALKLKFKEESIAVARPFKYYQEVFSEQVNLLNFRTIAGAEMPVSLYLREGLGLIIYTGAMKNDGLPHVAKMSQDFGAYNTDEWLRKPVSEVVFLLHRMSILFSDWSHSVFVYSLKGLAIMDTLSNDNAALAEFRKPEICSVKFDGLNREAVRLCWTETEGLLEYVELSPAEIGFRNYSPDQRFQVYIQRHALQRIEERLGLVAGVIHHEIFEQFKSGKLSSFRRGPSTLVSFYFRDKKLGYLVCGIFEEKIVIRSFLFLTNDGTPEGKKLSELTRLQRLDKKFLEIDSLSGFLGLKAANDPELSQLFTDAGCGDLLDLSVLEIYCLDDIKERGPEKLLAYLMGLGKGVEEEELVEG